MTENDIKDIVQEIDIDNEVKEKITDSFTREFGKMPPSAMHAIVRRRFRNCFPLSAGRTKTS